MKFSAIEKGVPIPNRGAKYPFHDMEPGDSLLLEGTEHERKLATAAFRTHARRRDYRVIQRKVGENKTRVWLIRREEK